MREDYQHTVLSGQREIFTIIIRPAIAVLVILVLLTASLTGSCNMVSSDDLQIGSYETLNADFPDFSLGSLNNRMYNQSYFSYSGVTLIPLWTTVNESSISEIDKLNEVVNEIEIQKLPAQICSICVESYRDLDAVNQIANETHIKYDTIIADEKISKILGDYSSYLPATLLVNNKGVIIRLIMGDNTPDQYIQHIKNAIKTSK